MYATNRVYTRRQKAPIIGVSTSARGVGNRVTDETLHDTTLPEIPGEPLKDRVYRLRKLRRLTQEQLARLVGVSKTQVTMVESGTTGYLMPKTLQAYADALQVPPAYILSGLNPHNADGERAEWSPDIRVFARAHGIDDPAFLEYVNDQWEALLRLNQQRIEESRTN